MDKKLTKLLYIMNGTWRRLRVVIEPSHEIYYVNPSKTIDLYSENGSEDDAIGIEHVGWRSIIVYAVVTELRVFQDGVMVEPQFE